MHLNLDNEQQLLRDSTRSFLAKDMTTATLRELSETTDGFEPKWWQQGAEMGWAALLVPEELGGGSVSGDGLIDLAMVAEEFGRVVAPGPLLPTNVVAAALAAADQPEAFAEVVERLVGGESIGTWAVYEPGRGWAPERTTAELVERDGALILNGTKDRVDSAGSAQVFLVVARTSDGLVQVLVDADADGVEIVAMDTLDAVRRFGQVSFSDVKVERTAVVTSAYTTKDAIEKQLQTALAIQCAETVGVMGKVLEFTIQWAFDRYSFGRPLASYQVLKHRFADMRTWLEACLATAAAAARAVQDGSPDAGELVSVAASYIGEKSTALIQDCVQIHGGIGVTWEHDIHLYLRRALVNRATYGTPNEHRLRLAALLDV